MGSIAGDLDVLGMANLLQALSMSQRDGRLTVSKDDETKVLHCGTHGIRLLSGSRRVSPLGEVLLRTRKITRDQLTRILADHPASGMPLGQYVTSQGILEQETIDKALREQAADEIYDLFTWTLGRFEFVETGDQAIPTGDGVLSSVVLDQGVMSIALEAARRIDHLARIREVIPGERLVPVVLEIPVAEGEPGLDRDSLAEILPFVDGKRSVARIIEESLYPKFTVLLTLYAMAQRGAAKIRDIGAPDGPETVQLRPPPDPRQSPGSAPAAVLLLGDPGASRMSLSLCLGNLGFTVIESPTPVDFEELLARTSANAVLVDVAIDTEEGLRLCTRLRERTRIPFIVFASTGSTQAVTNAFNSGARHVLLKPVNPDLLLERLGEMLEGGARPLDVRA